jgi:ABC-type polysaccharide/polyol phosphate transport system ATPase subunit
MNTDKLKRVIVDSVSKKFDIGFRKDDGALSKAVSLISHRKTKKEIQVLNSISFEVSAGENIGIIGRNGSGKSTLLRIIAGIYQADSGSVKTTGKMVYLNGLAQGLKDKLTMRENIFLVGSIMGLSQADIKRRFKEIVDFSELEQFLDTKIYQFSSGMVTRLSFSITIHCLKHHNPDILLLDEVFGSGGDIDFQNKAVAKMEELIKGGATVLLVSHSLDIINKYCDKVIWLDKGGIALSGLPADVTKAYSGI